MTALTSLPRPTDADQAPPALTLSLFEVDHLCALKGVRTPGHIAGAALAASGGQAPNPAVVHAGLWARGVLGRTTDGDDAVISGIDELLALITAPGLLVRIETDAHADADVHMIYATPERAVVETTNGYACLQYRELPLPDLIPFILGSAHLLPDAEHSVTGTHAHPTSTQDSIQFEAPTGPITEAAQLCIDGDLDAAVAYLVDGGVSTSTASTYITALSHHERSISVALSHRIDGVRQDTVIGWSDCGTDGNWLIDEPQLTATLDTPSARNPADDADLRSAPLTIRRATPSDIIKLVLDGLPGLPSTATPDIP